MKEIEIKHFKKFCTMPPIYYAMNKYHLLQDVINTNEFN